MSVSISLSDSECILHTFDDLANLAMTDLGSSHCRVRMRVYRGLEMVDESDYQLVELNQQSALQ